MQPGTVTITEERRGGAVIHMEGEQRISGWWEFARGDALAIVSMGSASEWEGAYPWAVDRRTTILCFEADAVLRQKVSGCSAGIEEEGGWITLWR
jgi:hypothetical protein